MTGPAPHDDIEHRSTQLRHYHTINPSTGHTIGCTQLRIITRDDGNTVYAGTLTQYFDDLDEATDTITEYVMATQLIGMEVRKMPVE